MTEIDEHEITRVDTSVVRESEDVATAETVPGSDDASPEASAAGSPGDPGADEPHTGGDSEDVLAAEAAELPADEARISSILESLLFAADRPLAVADFKRLLGDPNGARISQILERMRLSRAETGIQLVSVAGAWQLRTHPQNGTWVAKLVAGRPQRLSRAMMETLAIVAYRQPVTRPEVDEIRGVDCGPVLRTLLERGLVRAIGKKEEVGRPILYGTTPDFLKTFSMRDLTELPTLREFHELGAEERAKVARSDRSERSATSASATGPSGSGDRAGDAPDVSSLPMVTVSELPTYDPAEEDSLIDELENATQIATLATEAHAASADGDSAGGDPEHDGTDGSVVNPASPHGGEN